MLYNYRLKGETLRKPSENPACSRKGVYLIIHSSYKNNLGSSSEMESFL